MQPMDHLILEALQALATQVESQLSNARNAEMKLSAQLDEARATTAELATKKKDIEERLAKLGVDADHLPSWMQVTATAPRARKRVFLTHLAGSQVDEMLFASSRAWRRDVVDRVSRILEANSNGWMHRGSIYEKLIEEGVVFKMENPEHRLAQILSSTETFENDRSLGWRLKKDETPGATGVPGERVSLPGTITLGSSPTREE